MTILRYEPRSLVNHLQNELNRIFQHQVQDQPNDYSTVETSQWMPLIDIKEEEHGFILFADVPGVNVQDIQILMDKQILTVKGTRKLRNTDEQRKYARLERTEGNFYRRFTLPETADGENITAQYRQGVLEIRIPKKEQTKPKQIFVTNMDEAKSNY